MIFFKHKRVAVFPNANELHALMAFTNIENNTALTFDLPFGKSQAFS